ncbi:MAG: hypothetical protein ACXW0I_03165 [Methylosarcina sp.]
MNTVHDTNAPDQFLSIATVWAAHQCELPREVLIQHYVIKNKTA